MFRFVLFYGLLAIATVDLLKVTSFQARYYKLRLFKRFILISNFSSYNLPSTNFPLSEYEALHDLFIDTGGDNWAWKSFSGKVWDFLEHVNPCDMNWQGITCSFNATSNTSNVERIILPDFNLVGFLPRSIGNFTKLTDLVLELNCLQGPVPDELERLLSLEVLYMNHNRFSGSLPDLSKLVNLLVFDFYTNELTGDIPPYLELFTQLVYLDLYKNHFTGCIPSYFGNLTNLIFFYMGENHFTGTLPESFGNLINVEYFYFNDCHLSGSLPVQLANLRSLVYFFVSSNYFSGNLLNVFNPTTQQKLSIVLVYENHFSGQLPEGMLRLPKLAALNAGSTCMHGSLPVSLCNSSTLQVLALDGLHTSSACQSKIFPWLGLHTYRLQPSLSGGVPDCLYEVPTLITLRLSSTGLTGTLPAHVRLGPNFTDFGASHNFLHGPIPEVFQAHSWQNFDVSYNKLGGTLSKNKSPVLPGQHLDLRNNRLSGRIPRTLVHSTGSISILEGNLYECNLDHSDLPQHDPNYNKVTCGTYPTDFAFYVWIGLILLGGVIAWFAYSSLEQHWDYLKEFVAEVFFNSQGVVQKWVCENNLYNYYRIRCLENIVLRLCAALALYNIVVLLPLFSVLSAYYGTLSYQYAYNVSLAFIWGYVPLALCMTAVLALLAFFYRSFFHFAHLGNVTYDQLAAAHVAPAESQDSEERGDSSLSQAVQNRWNKCKQKGCIYATLVVLDMALVGAVNVAFVGLVLNGDRSAMWVAPSGLAVFKMLWDKVRSYAVDRIAVKMDEDHQDKKKGLLTAYTLISLFSNFVIPVFVVAFKSSTCFHDAFFRGERVESNFSYTECWDYVESGCSATAEFVFSSKFYLPFVYTYQCASTILAAYLTSFIVSCTIEGVLMPALNWLLTSLLPCFRRTSVAFMLHHDYVVPAMARILPLRDEPVPRDASPFLDTRTYVVSLVLNLTVIMTFGMVFPPLAVAMALTMFSKVYFCRWDVRKFVNAARAGGNSQHIARLDSECVGVGTPVMLYRAMLLILVLSSLFCSLFLFDMVGAYWILIVMCVPPVLLCPYAWTPLHQSRSMSAPQLVNQSVENDEKETEIVTYSLLQKAATTPDGSRILIKNIDTYEKV